MTRQRKNSLWQGDVPRSGASHGNSVVQVIGPPSVKIVHGALLSWQPACLRFPRYLHQTIIVATGKRNVLDERLPKLLPITSFCTLVTHISSSVPCIRDHPSYFFYLLLFLSLYYLARSQPFFLFSCPDRFSDSTIFAITEKSLALL